MSLCRRVLLIAGKRPTTRHLCSRLEQRGLEVHVIPVAHAQLDAHALAPHVVVVDADLTEDACVHLRHALRARLGAPIVCVTGSGAAHWRDHTDAGIHTTTSDDAPHVVGCLLGTERLRAADGSDVSDTSSY